MVAKRKPGTRAGLSTDKVVSAAVIEVEENGLAGLSMRAVARRLGVAPNALYSHVVNRNDLVDMLIDGVLGNIQPIDIAGEDPDPFGAIIALMTETYDVLINHSSLVPAYLARQGSRGPNAIRLGMHMDHWLNTLGIPESAIPEARRVLIIHVIGNAAFATAGSEGGRPITPGNARRLCINGLRWLLDGIRNMADDEGSARLADRDHVKSQQHGR